MSDRDEQFQQDLDRILETEEGVRVFRQLVKDFNFNRSTNIMLSTTGEVSPLVLVNNEAIRSFWVELRRHISYDKLILIEYESPTDKERQQCQMKERAEQERQQLLTNPAEQPLHRASVRNKLRAAQAQTHPNQD